MTMLDAALALADRGFAVFPVHGIVNGKCTCNFPGCQPPTSGKHPVTKNGFKDATHDAEKIREWWARNPNWNIAVATGARSRIWVLDIDGSQGEETISALEKVNGKIPATLESTTGRGRHLIFKHQGEEIKNSGGKIGLKIDTRGDGGYIVAPPSNHYSGATYTFNDATEIADAPDWLYALAIGEKVTTVAPSGLRAELIDGMTNGAAQEWEVADVRNMLEAIDPDVGYHDWLHIGMALHEGGYPVTLWDEWSRRGKKYRAGDCVKRWRGFHNGGGRSMGTLVEMAELCGWEPRRVEHDPIGAAMAARIHARFMAKKNPVAVREHDFPVIERKVDFPDALKIEGIIGDTVRWLVDTAIKPQPELALLHVLAALGAVFGRRYKGQGRLDTRTNLYTIGIAGTGSGKDHSRKQMSVLMNSTGLSDFIGANRFVSDAGLVTALKKKPSQIMPIDEIGMVLQMIGDKKASGYQKNIATHLLTLYSSSGGFFNSGQYADEEKEEVVIPAPNLCIYGTTTEKNYIKALTSDSVSSGEMNRFIVVPVSNEIPERHEDDMVDTSPPQNLVAAWEILKPTGTLGSLNSSEITPTPSVVVWTREIALRLKNMGNIEDEKMRENVGGVGALWNRFRENTLKIAMIFAISRNQSRPEIVSRDLDIAEGIIVRSINYMKELCLEHVSDTDHQKECQIIFKALKDLGGSATKSQLTGRIGGKLNPQKRQEAIETLMEQGTIVTEDGKAPRRGFASQVFKINK